MDITEKRREDTRRMLMGLLKLIDKADLAALNTIFRTVHYLRSCLERGDEPKLVVPYVPKKD